MASARAPIFILLMASLTLPVSAIPRDETRDASRGRQLGGHTLICFYRGLDWESAWPSYAVRVHGERVGKLAVGSYLHHLTEPGRRMVFVEADVNVSRSFVLRSGEIYYIQIGHKSGSVPALPKLRLVDPAKGVSDLAGLSYAGPEIAHGVREYCLRNDAS